MSAARRRAGLAALSPPPWGNTQPPCRQPSALRPRAAQYQILKFPPLVVASSALLCAWSHLGNTKAIETHMHELCCLCGVAQHELLPCKTILLEHFNTTYPKAAEAAERHRAANAQRLAAAGRSSPDSVMDCHAPNVYIKEPPSPVTVPDVPMGDADAPEYSFYPVQ